MGYDALLVVAFGGPERAEDVMPFLERVVAGKGVPRERLLEVAQHYYDLGGGSPLNDQVRALRSALETRLRDRGVALPLYWGNRNWHPLLADTLGQMAHDGVRSALGLFLSAYSSYSGCRQYQENIAAARAAVGESAPVVERVRSFFNHPGYVAAWVAQVDEALATGSPLAGRAEVMFTAHSLPVSMAGQCAYEAQLRETAGLIVAGVPALQGRDWQLVFQSRSGPPSQPWLEPDVCDALRASAAAGSERVLLIPVGFLSDHMEVRYDLDVEARAVADALGLELTRVATPGVHPAFVEALCDLIAERLDGRQARAAIGALPAAPDRCAPDCCPAPPARPRSST